MSKKHSLTIFSLTMITVGSVDSIRNLPATALFGSQLIFYFILRRFIFPYSYSFCFGRIGFRMGKTRWNLYLGERSLW